MTTPLVEPALGQPGWNVVFKAMMDRINALDERILDTVGAALIAGSGITVNYNDAAGSITLSSSGGAGSLDTEALMDHLAAHIVPGTNMGLTYDDGTGEITLNATGGSSTGPVNPSPSLHDLVAWTLDPGNAGSSTAPGVGDLVLLKINIPVAATIASAVLQVATAGSGLSNCYVALFDSTGARIALSADQSTAFQSGGAKTVAFTTPPSVAAGEFYVAILIGGGTAPALSRGASSTVTNLGLVAADGLRSMTAATSQTSVPSSVTLSSATANNTAWCVGLRAA